MVLGRGEWDEKGPVKLDITTLIYINEMSCETFHASSILILFMHNHL